MNTPRQTCVRRRATRHLRWAALLLGGLTLVTCSDALPRAARGQDTTLSTFEKKLASKGTIILKDATLSEWIFAIQAEWDVNIVVSSEHDREGVSGAFNDEPLTNVLTAVLVSQGYGYRIVGNSLIIVPNDELKIKPGQKTAIFELRALDPTSIEQSIQLMLSPDGQVRTIGTTQSLVVIDLPEHLDRVERFLTELEPPETTPTATTDPDASADAERIYNRFVRTFDPQFINAEQLAEVMQTTLEDASVSFLEGENRIVVSGDNEDVIAAAAQLLQTLDQPRPQVRITALLYDVNVELLESLGFNWNHNTKTGSFSTPGQSGSTGSLDSSLFNAGGGGAAAGAAAAATTVEGALLTMTHLSQHFDVTAVLQALNQADGARLLARPTVVASDRTEATFEAVSEIPVQQLTQTADGGQIGTTEFREAGITLTVTPRIMNDGSIVLDVSPEFSVLAGFEAGQPIIDRRQATTTLQITHGDTVVIGGMRRRNELETQNGIPGLRDLKYVGQFFKHHTTTVTESELLVFIKAEILEVGAPGRQHEEITGDVVHDLLNAIPTATHGPIMPHCDDPYCHYHNPMPRAVEMGMPYDHLPPGAVMANPRPHDSRHESAYEPAAPEATDAIPAPQPPSTAPRVNTPPPATSNNTDQEIEIPAPVVIEEDTAYRQLRSMPLSTARLPAVVKAAPPVVIRSGPSPSTVRRLPTTPPAPARTVASPPPVVVSPLPAVEEAATNTATNNRDPEQRRNWLRSLFRQ